MTTTAATAATISAPLTVPFGNVSIGDTANQTVSASFTLGGDEFLPSISLSGLVSPFSIGADGCSGAPSSNPCSFTVSFTPTVLGLAVSTLQIALSYTYEEDFVDFSDVIFGYVLFSGTGIDPLPDQTVVPIPAALPLFATGLGALGLLGWRRKRKNVAANAA